MQARLDVLCADAVIEDVLQSAEAHALRERLRRRALEVIEAEGKAAQKRARFVALVNAARKTDIAAKLGAQQAPLPVTWKAVEQFLAMLAISEALLPVLERLERDIGEHASGNEAVEHAALVDAIAVLEASFPTDPSRSVAVIHALAIALHRRARYDLIAPILRSSAPDQNALMPQLAAAITGHLRGTARAIVRRLDAACSPRDAWENVALDADARGALDALLARYGEVLDATVKAGLIDHHTLRFPVRAACGELQAAIENTVVPRLNARIAAAGAARHQPTVDHADVVRLAGWLTLWTRTMRRAALVGETAVGWRDAALADLRKEFDAAIRLEPGADLLLRMEHLGRLHELASSLGGDITPWLMVISVNTLAIIRRRLEHPAPLPPAEAAIALSYLGLVEAEMKRTRHWQIDELAEFRDIARRRLAM